MLRRVKFEMFRRKLEAINNATANSKKKPETNNRTENI